MINLLGSKKGKALAMLLTFLVVLAAAMTSRPYYNWDMLMYVGVADLFHGDSLKNAHTNAFATTPLSLPSEIKTQLLQGSTYQQTIAADSQAFVEILPFYTVKPVYPALISLLETLGVNAVNASVLIAQVSLALLAVVCCFWLRHFLSPWTTVILAVLIAFMPFVFHLARYSSPDALSVLMITTIAVMFLQLQRLSPLLVAAMGLAILIRPDNIIFVLAVCVGWVVIDRTQSRRAMLAAVICLGTYLALTSLAHSHDWLTLVNQSFFGGNPYPRSNPAVLSAADIISMYIRQLHPQNSGVFLLMILLAGMAIGSGCLAFGSRSRVTVLAIVVFIGLVAHWLVAPNETGRLRSGYGLISLLLLSASIIQLVAASLPVIMQRALLSGTRIKTPALSYPSLV